MDASFEEKSVWIQLISVVLGLGAYFVVAGIMVANGITVLPAFVPLFIAAIVLQVVVLVIGHAAVAIVSRTDGRDERDRLIEWRAESNSSWILGAGVVMAICGLIVSVDVVWIAHFLLVSLLIAEIAKLGSQLVYYRRGV